MPIPRVLDEALRSFRDEDDEDERRQRGNGDGTQTFLPPPSQPMLVAREFVAKHCIDDGGNLTLRYYRDSWWAWRQSHWTEVDARQVRSLLYTFTEHALYLGAKGDAAPWSPTRRKIGDLLEALGAIAFLSDEINQPVWLDGRARSTIVAVANGLLDVERRRLLPHSPQYLNMTSVPFDFDPGAPVPREWLAFLGELWPNEAEGVDLLQEWFGYVISGRTDLQKIMLCVGPTRAGKGLIARVLAALIGQENCCGPTLHSLSGDFGLAPLLNKSLAIVSDARLTSKGGNVVVERLLAVSGEDAITVNRKFRDQWTGKLPSRFHIISNELPRFGDASAAIVGRFLVLLLSRSWIGREDHDLEDRLRGELTSVLNWALDGLERLIAQGGRFTRLPNADEAVGLMRDLASPVGAFVREVCQIGGDQSIAVDELYTQFKIWAENNGLPVSSKQMFGRDLRAAVPSIKVRQEGTQDRRRVYDGIGLQPLD